MNKPHTTKASSVIAAEAIVIRFCVFLSDRRLLIAVLILFWKLKLRSAATLDTGIS